MGTTVTMSFTISMGDTSAPRISYNDDTRNQDKWTRTYRVNDRFTFNTGNLRITGTRDPELFEFTLPAASNWLYNSQRNENFTITIMTHGGQILTLDDDHDYTITTDNFGREQHEFRFREPGTYYITFRVRSQSGVWGTREFRVTVEERPERQRVAPETVWGAILIIASIGLFAGVVIYFWRTGSQTKFASAKTKTKKPAAQKTNEDSDGGVV